jgi:hypothetical protein
MHKRRIIYTQTHEDKTGKEQGRTCHIIKETEAGKGSTPTEMQE